MALSGRPCGSHGFTKGTLADLIVRRLQSLVVVHPEEARKMLDFAVEVVALDGFKYVEKRVCHPDTPVTRLTWMIWT